MVPNTSVATPSAADPITPEAMAHAGVPFPLAFWYHMIGRRLSRFSDWDVERIMEVRGLVAASEL